MSVLKPVPQVWLRYAQLTPDTFWDLVGIIRPISCNSVTCRILPRGPEEPARVVKKGDYVVLRPDGRVTPFTEDEFLALFGPLSPDPEQEEQ